MPETLNLTNVPAFRVYALCAVVLVLKMFLLAFYTGAVRRRVGVHVNPEDKIIHGTDATGGEHPDVLRIHRAHRNDLENILPFLAVGLLYVFAGGSTLGARAYFITFTAARVLHTIAYLRGLQPWRTLLYGVGALATLGMMAHIALVALRAG